MTLECTLPQQCLPGYLWRKEDELQVRVLQAVAEQVLHGHTPVDGIHEDIKLIHGSERGLRPLT